MATFGQGINPQLGAIDYSPILQGSVAGAQMAAKGGQMIGQGLANLGQEVGQGIQKYAEQKKKNAERDGRVDAALGAIQANAKIMDRYGQKDAAASLRLAGYNLIQEPNLDKRAAMADTAVSSFLQGQQIEAGAKQRQLGEQAAQYVRAATQAGGNPFSAVVKDAAGGYSPMGAEAQTLGQGLYQQQQLVASQIDKYLREKQAPAGRIMTAQELKNIGPQYDFKSTPLPDGTFFVTNISPFGPGTQNVINMGEKAYEKGIGEAAAAQHMGEYAAAVAAPEALAKLDEVQGLIKSGNVTTGIGAELIQNANRLRAQFANDIKAGKTVSNTQLLDSLLGSDVFPMIGALGIGAKGMDTPAEREFLRQSFTGTKEFTPETLSRLTEIRRNMHLRAVDKFQKSNEKGTYKRFFDISGNPVPDFSGIPPIKGLNGEPLDIPYQTWQNMPEERRKLFRK